MNITNPEDQFVNKVGNLILTKSKNRRTSLITYTEVTKEINVPITIVQAAARQVCKWLLTIPVVEDVDITDDCFDVMIKRRTA